MLPKIFRKNNTCLNVFLVFRPFPCHNAEKIEVFLQNHIFADIFQKKKQTSGKQIVLSDFFFCFFENLFSGACLKQK